MDPDLFLAILAMDAYNRPGTENSTTTVGLVLPTGVLGYTAFIGDGTLQ